MIKLTPEEKELIIAAIEIEKIVQERSDDEDIEEIDFLEEEIKKENVFLSRRQLDVIIHYLGGLLQRKDQYDEKDVMGLAWKLEELTELP
ncbi:hypothetical protein [uncultured Chryseobacterium sp.]|uniref:hypothetical protein n=1 Tax=uncultured Chryseobacterium sp. TaxID=259322 RepID=UPI0025D4D507|nr:hypothetical protein [uncultured Chryseobacterium sp.]